jgi:hypothetical protein
MGSGITTKLEINPNSWVHGLFGILDGPLRRQPEAKALSLFLGPLASAYFEAKAQGYAFSFFAQSPKAAGLVPHWGLHLEGPALANQNWQH